MKDSLTNLISYLSATGDDVYMSSDELQELLYSTGSPLHLPKRYSMADPSTRMPVRPVLEELGLVQWGGTKGFERLRLDSGGVWRT